MTTVVVVVIRMTIVIVMITMMVVLIVVRITMVVAVVKVKLCDGDSELQVNQWFYFRDDLISPGFGFLS